MKECGECANTDCVSAAGSLRAALLVPLMAIVTALVAMVGC